MAQWIQDRLQEQTIAEAVTRADKKRLVSQGRPGGMAMFNMIPGHEDAYWTTPEFTDELREVLGLPSVTFYDDRFPNFNHSAPKTCHLCGVTLTRAHAGRCIKNGAVGKVHNICRDTIFRALRAHDLGAVLEPRNRGNDERAGPDMEITDPNFGNKRFDVTTTDVRTQANASQEYPAHAAELRKLGSPDAAVAKRQGYIYMGLGLETSGGSGPGLLRLWSELWEHVRVKGRHNVWRQNARTNTLPLSATLDNPIWTAPTITTYWIQKLSSDMRYGLAIERKNLVDRFATMFAASSFAHAPRRPRTESPPRTTEGQPATTNNSPVNAETDPAQTARLRTQQNTHDGDAGAQSATYHETSTDTAQATMDTESAESGSTRSTTTRLNSAPSTSESATNNTPSGHDTPTAQKP